MSEAPEALIRRASEFLRPKEHTRGRLSGDVASVVRTNNGQIYSGVCIDTPTWGICAERSAIAAAVTAGEYLIDQVVAVWRDSETGLLHVLPPCGGCRQFMIDLNRRNLDHTRVVLGPDRSLVLRELIPDCDWPEPLPPEY